MKEYLLTVVAASLAVSVIGILSPAGEKGGLGKHVGLVSALILVCLIASPIKGALEMLRGWADGEIPVLDELPVIDYGELSVAENDAASKRYFTNVLTERIASQFSLDSETVRCAVQWQTRKEQAYPTHVTVILSGRSILQNPHEIEAYVSALLDCTCDVAIE